MKFRVQVATFALSKLKITADNINAVEALLKSANPAVVTAPTGALSVQSEPANLT